HWQNGGAPSGRHERYVSSFGHLLAVAGVHSTSEGLARWWRWARDASNDEVLQAVNRTAGLQARSARDEFSDAISALEIFGDRLQPGAAEHLERCDRLAEMILQDDPDRDWAIERLRSGRGFGLTTKLKKLRQLYPAAETLLGDDTAIKATVTARSRLSHGKSAPNDFRLRQVAHEFRQFIVVAALTEAALLPNPPGS
ncbi:MAG: HEPN domain-containing protein, partial [Rhodococcus sp. (in: high G+C Gram-positive bacteria)]